MFELKPLHLPGCYEIQPRVFKDARGSFVKVFQREVFKKLGLEVDFAEEYYSQSLKGVIRGMHFQSPPVDHVKMVYCVQGRVFDVLLDLRIGSPTYGQTASIELSVEEANFIYIPKGLAHGFCAISDVATMIYKVSTIYMPENDSGVLWSSIDLDWPTTSPVISERDSSFKPLSGFESPFFYESS